MAAGMDVGVTASPMVAGSALKAGCRLVHCSGKTELVR